MTQNLNFDSRGHTTKFKVFSGNLILMYIQYGRQLDILSTSVLDSTEPQRGRGLSHFQQCKS